MQRPVGAGAFVAAGGIERAKRRLWRGARVRGANRSAARRC